MGLHAAFKPVWWNMQHSNGELAPVGGWTGGGVLRQTLNMSTSVLPDGAPPPGALLQRIDALIRRDQKPAGIAGRVAVGVKRRSGVCEWLVAEFGEGTATRWTTNFPEFDAALGLDEEGSMELLAGKTPGPQRLCVKTCLLYTSRCV